MHALIFLRCLHIHSAVIISVKFIALNINGKLWFENINFDISTYFMIEEQKEYQSLTDMYFNEK